MGRGRTLDRMTDPTEPGTQPTCPNCGTVLHEAGHGYVCRGCKLVYLPNVDRP